MSFARFFNGTPFGTPPVKRLGIAFIKGGITVGVARALGVLVVPFEWRGMDLDFFGFKCDIKFQAPKPWEFILRFASKKTMAGKHTQLLPQMVVNNGDLLVAKSKNSR